MTDVALDDPRVSPPSGTRWGDGLRDLLPRASDYAGARTSWRRDVIAGVTVGVVALPLALGFGVVSGVGAAAGLVTAVVAGIVAAVFGGSHVQVSGPTGAMAVVLVPIVGQYGAGSVATVAVLAGVLVVVAGVLRLGRFVNYLPWPVIEGFTVGIATIIFLQQVPAALGSAAEPGQTALLAAIDAVRDATTTALVPLLLTIGVAVLIVTVTRLRRTLPSSLLAVVLATAATAWLGLVVPQIGALPSTLPVPTLPPVDPGTVRALLSAAVAVAALAALESLLSARVADGMSDTHRADPDRELLGQGLANVASGLVGGLPATGAIARTAVNVRAGARTRLASIMHALVVLLAIVALAPLVARVPLAALAGVLMVTAVRMVDRHAVRAVVRSTRSDAVVLVATASVTIVFDLILAVEVGIALAVVLALRAVTRASGAHFEGTAQDLDVVDDDTEQELLHRAIAVYRLDGALYFGAAQRFLEEFTRVADVRAVVLRISGVRVLDASGARALAEIVDELQGRGITVLLKGVSPSQRPLLERVGVTRRLDDGALVFDSLDDAIARARELVAA